nr:reverse transcriptase domain-containing protein [Tanacetum cinerariifolium]
MRTRSKSYPNNSNAAIPRRSNKRRVPNIVEPEIRTIEEVVPMADRTMEELLQAPMEGDVPNDAIKLMLFLYSLEGAARIWYEKEPPNSILTWDDLEILRACPHHGFSELTQIDTFYNGLNEQDQDSLNAAAGGNLLIEIVNKQVITPATAKAVEKTCVICKGSFFQNQASTFDTLSSNIVPNPKGEMKAITTRSGLAYEGPSIPINSPFEKLCGRSSFLHKFDSTIKSLLTNKDKLFELAKVPLNKNCLAMLLKKLPEKLGDPGKFLIPCDFPRIDVCHALANLGASINLMPLSIWKKLSLPELTPTRMTLELVDRSITRPKGVAEDVFIKVGKFHFPTNFVVVDFEADPRFPLILGRSFFRTVRALIDVYREEITLRVNDESVTFNLNQTMRYSSMYDDHSVNRVDLLVYILKYRQSN